MSLNVRDWFCHPYDHLHGFLSRFVRNGFGAGLRFYVAKVFGSHKTTVREVMEAYGGDYKGVYVIPVPMPWNAVAFQRAQQMAMAIARSGWLSIFVECLHDNPSGSVTSPYPGVKVLAADDFPAALKGVRGALISVYSTAAFWADAPDLMGELARDNDVVYEYIDHIDEMVSGRNVGKVRRIFDVALEMRHQLKFLASARVLVAELERAGAKDVAYVPNGVEQEHFSEANVARIRCRVSLPSILASDRPKVGYFGSLAKWLDAALLNEVMRRHPEWDFILIGPEYVHGAAEIDYKISNCHWLGPVPYADLPAYAACFDVAILPFSSGDVARSTSPVKLFEYFALGKPIVVTSEMVECTAHTEVLTAAGVEQFEKALQRALELRFDMSYVGRLKRLAHENTWDERARALLEISQGG